jgi:hypothetical protein
MASRRSNPPWDYLQDASLSSLESYELSRLNHAANLSREIAQLIEQCIEDTAQALLARWIREYRALAPSARNAYQCPSPPELLVRPPLSVQEALHKSQRQMKFPRTARAAVGR